jgi:hypothetical protein
MLETIEPQDTRSFVWITSSVRERVVGWGIHEKVVWEAGGLDDVVPPPLGRYVCPDWSVGRMCPIHLTRICLTRLKVEEVDRSSCLGDCFSGESSQHFTVDSVNFAHHSGGESSGFASISQNRTYIHFVQAQFQPYR